MHNPVPSQHP